MQPEVVRTLEAKKGVAAAGSAATKPIEPKERPPVKEAAKKPPVEKPQVEKPKPPVFPVDDGYDEEREKGRTTCRRSGSIHALRMASLKLRGNKG